MKDIDSEYFSDSQNILNCPFRFLYFFLQFGQFGIASVDIR